MVNIAGSYDQNAQVQTRVPNGKYKAHIIESTIEPVSKTSENGDSLVLTWSIVEGENTGRIFFQRLNLYFRGNNARKVVEIANSQFAEVRKATGCIIVNDSNEMHNRPCWITIGDQRNKPEYQEIKRVEPIAASGSQRSPVQTSQTVSSPASVQNQQSAGPVSPNSPFSRPQSDDIPF